MKDQSKARAMDLRCEYLRNPLGIDVCLPRLTWIMESDVIGQRQTAYRITVASSEKVLGSEQPDLWDSGKIASDQSAHVPYAGKPLAGGQRCYWQVQLWDKDGDPTPCSETAWWEMGLLEPGDWKAAWITRSGSNDEKYSPLFRRDFQVGQPVSRARLYICGIGLYEAHINGNLVSYPLARPESVIPDRALYDTYDVTAFLRHGANALGVWLGLGWWAKNAQEIQGWVNTKTNRKELEPTVEKLVATVARPNKYMVIAQLAIEYADGARELVTSDERFRTAPGWLEPFSHAGFHYKFKGESYDGEVRQTLAGWNTASFDDGAWAPALTIKSPTRRLAASMLESNRVVETLSPVSSEPIPARADWLPAYLEATWANDLGGDIHVLFKQLCGRNLNLPSSGFLGGIEYDFGTLVSGRVRLKVTGAKGDLVSILGLDHYRLSGEKGEEIFVRSANRFFRHAPILFFGNGKAPEIEDIHAESIRNDIPVVGRFECSDSVLKRIHDVSARTLAISILRGLPLDSAREKYATYFMNSSEDFLYGLDTGAFMAKWLTDHRDLQGRDGYPWGGAPIAHEYAAWAGLKVALNVIPPLLYFHYGDKQGLKENYAALRRSLEYFFRQEGSYSWQAPDGDAAAYASWPRPGDESVPDLKKDGRLHHAPLVGDLMDTFVLVYALDLSLFAATELNETNDVRRFTAWRARLVEKANRPEYFDRERGVYGVGPGYAQGDMGCQALALALNIVPVEARERAFARLLHDIMVNRNGHLNTGFWGTYFLLQCLIKFNRPDVAYSVIRHPVAPSYATITQRGNGTMSEFWETDYPGGNPHPGLCCVGFWFYRSLGGINPDPQSSGFKRVVVRPQIVRELTWVKAEYDSIHGTIKSHWTLDGERLKMTVRIPANTSALIRVPARDKQSVMAPEHDGVRFVRLEDDAAIFEADSGMHVFESTLPPIRSPAVTIAADLVSSYKCQWRVSDPLENATLHLEKPPTLTWKPATADGQSGFLNVRALHGECGGVVYAEGELEAPVEMKAILLLGADGPCKVWLDGTLIGEAYKIRGPVTPDTERFPATLTKGRHTITVLLDRRGGRAWGFCLRIKRPVANATERELPAMDIEV